MKRGSIIIIGGEKGGVGKSTLVSNIATEIARQGGSVNIADCEKRQNTIMNWIFRRNEQIDAGEKIPLIQGQVLQGKIRDVLIDLAQRYDSIVIDVSGSDTSEQRTALSVADIFIAPLRPSQNDLETVKRVSDFVEGAKDSGNTKLKAFALLNVAPTNPSIDEVKEAQSALSVYKENLPLLSTIIYDRKIYRDAFVEGKGVVEMKNEKAIQEIQNLVEELFV